MYGKNDCYRIFEHFKSGTTSNVQKAFSDIYAIKKHDKIKKNGRVSFSDHPFWARSLNKQPLTVIASDEKDARKKAMAMENNDNAVLEVAGADNPLSPWKNLMLVHAEVIRFDLGPY